MHSISDLRFLQPATLRAWFQRGSTTSTGKFAVVDVRDSDYVGGHIRGCYHYPADKFEETLPELRKRLVDNKINDVVFHCALSQVRGPSSTLRFLRSLDDVKDPIQRQYFHNVNVWVLEGGFTRWQQHYGTDEAVTEGYDKEIWEFGY